jgi:hypothetical protein
MKQKFLMLLAAVLLSCTSAMAQSGNNEPLKGDVNGDGKVDVADIVAILDIMKNGTKELQSIKWASTTAVNGTTGTTPSLGDITLTYNDGTTGTVAYNASGVTLFTDAAGNTPFSNANSGTFNVWAKYCGVTTTNSKQVTLSTPVPGTYYWYVGKDESKVGKSGTSYNLDLTQLSTVTSINSIYTNSQSLENIDNNVYVVCPTSWVGQFKLVDLNDTDISLSDKTSQITSNVTGYSVLRGNGKIGDSVIKIIRQ